MFAAVRRRVDMKKKRWYISVNGCVVIESSRGVDFSRALSLLSAKKNDSGFDFRDEKSI